MTVLEARARSAPLAGRRVVSRLRDACARIPHGCLGNSAPDWFQWFTSLKQHDKYALISRCAEDAGALPSLVSRPFFAVLRPLLVAGLDETRAAVQELNLAVDGAFYVSMLKTLHQDLLKICGLTLYTLLLEQVPDPTATSYEKWIQSFGHESWLQAVTRYPMLGRYLFDSVVQSVAAVREVLSRLKRDLDDLVREGFVVSNAAQITASDFALSDRHVAGRRVVRLRFVDGSSLIYKPRELLNEALVNQELFSLLPAGLRVGVGHRILARPGYGWTEDVLRFTSVRSPEELWLESARGAALLFLLNATDMHVENAMLTASGLHLVDLETLAAAPPFPTQPNEPETFTALTSGLLEQDLEATLSNIAGTCDLFRPPINTKPHYYFKECPERGVQLVVQDGRGPINVKVTRSAVTSQSIEAFTSEFTRAIVALRPILRAWLRGSSLRCSSRFVPRPTVFYERVQQRLYHPRLLTDGALVSLELADLVNLIPRQRRLARCWAAIVEDEFVQLARGDVPYFWYRWGSKTLHTPTSPSIPQFFAESGLEQLKARLVDSDLNEIAEQERLLRASLLMARASRSRANHFGEYPRRSTLLDDAPDLTEQLLQDWSVRITKAASVATSTPTKWLTLDVGSAHGRWGVQSGDRGFYGGYWGIVLGLEASAWALETHACSSTRELGNFLASEANDSRRWLAADLHTFARATPGLSGYAGVIRSWTLLSKLNPQRWEHLQVASVDLLLKALAIDNGDSNGACDYLSGTCGTVALAIGLNKIGSLSARPLERVLRRWTRCVRDEWYSSEQGTKHLGSRSVAGFAHGRAGLISTLASASSYWSNAGHGSLASELAEIARMVRGADDGALIATKESWYDLRVSASEKPLMNRSWCHGTTGIAMSRLDAMETQDYSTIRSDLARALRQSRAAINSQDLDIYCCGECGEIDMLADYAAKRTVKGARGLARLRGLHLVERLVIDGHFRGPVGLTTPELGPGLFQGAAGILYTLARLARGGIPRLVPGPGAWV
jgi:lantibiotic modifying enzyme